MFCNCKSYNLDGQAEGREEVVLARPDWMPDGERVNGVPVDACIAEVVRHLWANDVRTWGSCCGHNGRHGPPALLLDRREAIAEVRALIAEVDQRIWWLDWVLPAPPVPPWPGAETHDAGVHLGPLDDCLQCQPHDLGGGAGNREDRACVGDVSDPSPDQGVTPPPGHTTTDDCWCDPTVEVVPPAKPNLLNTWKKGQDPDGDTFLIWIDHRGAMWETDSPEDFADMLARIPDSPVDPWAELVETVGRLPAPPPVPPWPGAVLSGLTDEDGVPTWLAQAGQVRGEQVRQYRKVEWGGCEEHFDDSDQWVEVRAPRAVPVPETERVPWWGAKDRLGLAGDPFVEVGADDEGPWVRVVEGGTKLHSLVDERYGTVEVLRKDGDR